MTVRISSPAGAFASVKARINLALSGGTMDKVKKAMAMAAITEVGLGFRREENPYGEAWAPLKHRKGRILSDTGRLRRSFSYTVTATGFRIGSGVKYAGFHQGGTGGRKKASTRFQPTSGGRFVSRKSRGKRTMAGLTGGRVNVLALNFAAGSGKLPARPMVPTKQRGLGPAWSKALKKAAASGMRSALKKR